MAEINVTPLVDVMLVLLIIFMITAPLMSHKVKIELPEANLDENDPRRRPPAQPITLAVTEDGSIFWNDEPVTGQLLESALSVEAQKTPQPPVNIRGDQHHQVPRRQRGGQDRAGPGHAQGRLRRHPRKRTTDGRPDHGIRFRLRRRRPMADINVTPLVDVMLVLLIIFMVTAPIAVVPDRHRPAAAFAQSAAASRSTRRSRSGCASTPPARCSGTTARHRCRRCRT